MPIEDEDDSQNYRFHQPDDDSIDAADVSPDDLGTVRCTNCKKWILEGTPRCPYCRDYQLDDKQNKTKFWIVATALLLLTIFALCFIFWNVRIY